MDTKHLPGSEEGLANAGSPSPPSVLPTPTSKAPLYMAGKESPRNKIHINEHSTAHSLHEAKRDTGRVWVCSRAVAVGGWVTVL